MNIEQVKCVLAIVEHKTFLEAALALNRSQSAVSKEIKKLEQELGAPLFVRTTRKVHLTSVGEDFIRYGTQILEAYEGICQSVARHQEESRKKLRIGSIYFGRKNLLAPAIAQFINLHPSIEITVKDDTTSPLLHALLKNELDIIFVSSMYADAIPKKTFADDPSLKSISCFQDPYYVVVGKGHPFHGRKHLSFPELDNQAFIFTDSSMDVYHQALKRLFDHYHVTSHSSICCSSVRSVLHMVSQNLGIAILTRLVIEDSDDLDIIPLEGGLVRDTQMVMRNHPQEESVILFWNYMKQALNS